MKLSISMPSVYGVYDISLTEAYRALKSCGFQNTVIVEKMGETNLSAHVEAANCAGVTPVSAHIFANPFESEDALAYVENAVSRAADLGISSVVIPVGTETNIEHYDYLARNEAYLRGMLEIAERKNTKLLIENSGSYQVAHYLHHARAIRLLTDRLNHPLLGVNLNVGNLGLAEAQPYPQIRLLGRLIQGVDLSDNFGAMPLAVHPERQDFQLLPQMGFIDFDQVFEALTEIGFTGTCNVTTHLPMLGKNVYPSTGRPKFSREMIDRLYTWAFHVMKTMLTSYGVYEEEGTTV